MVQWNSIFFIYKSIKSTNLNNLFVCNYLDAAIVGQLKLVKMLVERGADPCFKNRKGKTPCDVAASAVYNFLVTARGEFCIFLIYNNSIYWYFARQINVNYIKQWVFYIGHVMRVS